MSAPPCTRRLGFALAAFALLVLAGAADAQTSWQGTTSNQWSISSNWSAGVPNSTTGAAFNASSTANLATDQNISGLSLPSIAIGAVPSATAVSISDLPFTLGSGGINTTGAATTQTFAVNTNMSLSANQTWTLISGPTVTIGASSSNTLNLSTTTGNTLTLSVASAGGTLAFNSVIADGAAPSGLSFTSTGTSNVGATIQFNAVNTYTGGTSLDARAAIYQVGSNSPFGATDGMTTGTITLTNNSTTPQFQSINGNHIIPNPINFTAGGFNTGGSNSLTFSGAWTLTVTRTISVNTAAGQTVTISGPVSVGSGATLAVGIGGSPTVPDAQVIVSGTISGAGAFSSTGNGNLTGGNNISLVELTGQNTYSGGTSMLGQAATFTIGSSSVLSGTTIVSGPFGTGTVLVNNTNAAPRLQAINGPQMVANPFTLASNLHVQGSTDITLSGAIAGSFGIQQAGTNNLFLTGANSYSGTNAITNGAMYVNGSNSSTTSATMATGTGTLGSGGTIGGNGSIAGPVTISSTQTTPTNLQGGIVSPGPNATSPGTLTVGSMTWNPLGRYVFAYSPTNTATGGGVNNYINGTGTLDLSTLSTSPFDLNLLQLSPIYTSQPSQTYTIASFAGGVGVTTGTDISGDFTFSGAYSGTPDAAVVAGSGGGSAQAIQVTFIPAVTPPPTSFTWTGSVSGSWMNANNWNPVFTPGSNLNNQLTFGATANAAMTNDIAGVLTLNSMTFNAGSPVYTLGGNGLNFVTNGSGTNPSIVSNSSNSVTISVPLTLTNNLTVSGSGPITLGGAIGGAGSLTYSGSSTLTLGTANSYSGGTNVLNGILQVASDAALGIGNVTGATLGTLSFTGSTSTTKSFVMNGGTIIVGPGQTVTFNGSQVTSATLDGSGTFATNGAIINNGNSTASVAIASNSAADRFVHFTNNGALTFAGGLNPSLSTAISNFNGFINQGTGSVTIGAGSAINAVNFQSYGTLTLLPNTTGAPTVFTNTGAAALGFDGGSRTFIGTPGTADPTGQNIVDYVDLHGHNAIVTDGLFVNNGGVYDTVGAGTSTVIADYGSLVKGAGFYQNTVKTQNGGKFQTGNSPGSATFGNFVFGPGGVNNYVFAIDNATGTAGPSPGSSGLVSGWGLIKAVQASLGALTTSGSFTWTATPNNPLTVAIDTLVNPTMSGTDVAGPMANFDPNQAYSWTAAQWTGTYSGPSTSAALDAATGFETTDILNPIAGTFGWNLDSAAQTLALVYTPSAVPEPGTLALVGVGLLGVWRARRRSGSLARSHVDKI